MTHNPCNDPEMPTYTPWGYDYYDYPTVTAFLAAHPECGRGWPTPCRQVPVPGHRFGDRRARGVPGGLQPVSDWSAFFCAPAELLGAANLNPDIPGIAVAYHYPTGRVHVLPDANTLREARAMILAAVDR